MMHTQTTATKKQSEQKSQPWYRYSIMWLVVGLPLLVVVASIITINIAIDHKPQIVTNPIQDNAAQ